MSKSRNFQDLRSVVNEQFKPLVQTYRKAEQLAVELGLSLGTFQLTFPRIVVVGVESAGKSSVLERLARKRLFPRGKDLTTRMPVVLSLNHYTEEELNELATNNNYVRAYGQNIVLVSHPDGSIHQITDDDSLVDRIQEIMDRFVEQVNGNKSGIIDKELRVELYGTEVPDLELVDLPGVVQGVLPGEPLDIAKQTEQLTAKYLDDPNVLTLVVIPGPERNRNNAIWKIIQSSDKAGRMHDTQIFTAISNPFGSSNNSSTASSTNRPASGFGSRNTANRPVMAAPAPPVFGATSNSSNTNISPGFTIPPPFNTRNEPVFGVTTLPNSTGRILPLFEFSIPANPSSTTSRPANNSSSRRTSRANTNNTFSFGGGPAFGANTSSSSASGSLAFSSFGLVAKSNSSTAFGSTAPISGAKQDQSKSAGSNPTPPAFRFSLPTNQSIPSNQTGPFTFPSANTNQPLSSPQLVNITTTHALHHTIGVITKADLVVPLESLQSKLRGKSDENVPLSLGYVGLYNSNTIHEGLYDDMIKTEREFFEHADLVDLKKDGFACIDNLIAVITKGFHLRIQNTLNRLRERLGSLSLTAQFQRAGLGKTLNDGSIEQFRKDLISDRRQVLEQADQKWFDIIDDRFVAIPKLEDLKRFKNVSFESYMELESILLSVDDFIRPVFQGIIEKLVQDRLSSLGSQAFYFSNLPMNWKIERFINLKPLLTELFCKRILSNPNIDTIFEELKSNFKIVLGLFMSSLMSSSLGTVHLLCRKYFLYSIKKHVIPSFAETFGHVVNGLQVESIIVDPAALKKAEKLTMLEKQLKECTTLLDQVRKEESA